MTREEELYQVVCQCCGVEALSDADIHRAALLLKGRLDDLADLPQLGVGEPIYIDPDIT